MTRTRVTGGLALALLASGGCSSGNDNTNPSNGVSLSFTPCTRQDFWPVVMLALQDGSGPWTVRTASGGTFSATVQSSKIGILVVTAPTTGSGSEVDVIYATTAEAQNYLTSLQCGSPLLTGNITVNNLAAGEEANVGLGWNSSAAIGPGDKTFTTQAPAATADLLGALSNANTGVVSKLILRRAVTVSAVAPVDFTTAEAFAPVTPTLNITGAGTNPALFIEWYLTGGIFRNEIAFINSSLTPPTSYYGMPAAKQAASDLHDLYTSITPPASGGVQPFSLVEAWWHDPAARTLNFEPLPATPTITTRAVLPYPQLRAQWQEPSGHKYFQMHYYNSSNSDVEATITATAAYLGSTAVDISFPDVSTLAGWHNNWMPVAGVATTWGFNDYTWTGGSQGVLSNVPSDGLVTQLNSWRGSITP